MKITIKLPEDVIAQMLEVNRTPWNTTPTVEECAERHLFEAAMGNEITEGDEPDPMFGPPIVREWRDVTVQVREKDLGWILTGIVAYEVRLSFPPGPRTVLYEKRGKDDVEDDDIPF